MAQVSFGPSLQCLGSRVTHGFKVESSQLQPRELEGDPPSAAENCFPNLQTHWTADLFLFQSSELIEVK